MDKKDKQRILSRYNRRLEDYGNSIKTLASGSDGHRRIRFSILQEVGISSGDSVLDLGCGFGDFLGYLQTQNLDILYKGVDINPNIIELAKKKYPEGNFEVLDILDDTIEDNYDYIVSTSTFNLKLLNATNYSFIEKILKKCYKSAVKGVAIDFLTNYVDYKSEDEEVFYYNPEKVFSLAKHITKRVTLRHDYPLFEFCIYLYPDFEGWSEKK